ncbi:ribosome biogenesis GTPase Der [Candidatus Peregrinibacteria bacterium]|nr:MAG: ribosome biogenesis GTPase Der [Candidatus Peregrinibacteria bacterium]
MKVPIVSIIGKPNVGKSTFFNRLTKTRLAITADEAGTTRDRIFYKVSHPELDFFLVDTGGLDFSKNEGSIEDDMQAQAKIAVQDADLILFMISSTEGLTKDDFRAAEHLRKHNKNASVILVANKCDNPLQEGELAELFTLGLGEPVAISAVHNQGIDKLTHQVIKGLKERHFLVKSDETYKKNRLEEQKHPNIAIVGRPNVGKSSTINALLNEDKLIVSNIPGTTRDSTDSLIKHKSKTYNFIDTAGLRRRSQVKKGIETFSVLRTLAAIERCDIAILMLDSTDEISHQDQQIAHTILEANKGMIIVANKWDLKDDEAEDEDEKKEVDAKRLEAKEKKKDGKK